MMQSLGDGSPVYQFRDVIPLRLVWATNRKSGLNFPEHGEVICGGDASDGTGGYAEYAAGTHRDSLELLGIECRTETAVRRSAPHCIRVTMEFLRRYLS